MKFIYSTLAIIVLANQVTAGGKGGKKDGKGIDLGVFTSCTESDTLFDATSRKLAELACGNKNFVKNKVQKNQPAADCGGQFYVCNGFCASPKDNKFKGITSGVCIS